MDSATWAFARFTADGEPIEFIHDERGAEASPLDAAALKAEVAAQLRRGVTAPAAVTTLTAIAPYRFGITSLYGLKHLVHGALIVLRNGKDGPFSRTERSRIDETLIEGTEALERLSVFEGEQAVAGRIASRSFPAQFVLDRELHIESAWHPENSDDLLATMLSIDSTRLPPAIEDAVRGVVSHWTDDPKSWQEAVVIPLPFLIVRVVPLEGPAGLRIGVLVERYRARNALRLAIQRFRLSQREVQVLGLLLQGRGTIETASGLGIAESTVNDHIKRLLMKTRARNRVELAAKVLGWRSS